MILRSRSLARPLALVCSATAVLSLAACGGSGSGAPKHSSAAPTTSPPTTASSHATPKPAPTHRAAAVNPLTGLPGVPQRPVIAVKIDDTAPGRPQVGIDHADVVYIEVAEGGLTRLAAIYASHMPVVGYVRSTRPSDPDLFLQYGKITEAASGGGHDALPLLDRSGINGWINDRGAPYYYRVSRPQSTYINLLLNLDKVSRAIHTGHVHSIGWTWNASVSSLPSSSPGTDVRTYVGSTPVEFRYNAKWHMYYRYIDGVLQKAADGKPIGTPNVIVQQCRIVPHPQDTDVNGNPSQWTYTTGSGAVSIFRDGRRINATWYRPHLASGTRLLDVHHHDVPLHPGGAWVVLVRNGTSISG
jgi:hypothetical protein